MKRDPNKRFHVLIADYGEDGCDIDSVAGWGASVKDALQEIAAKGQALEKQAAAAAETTFARSG
jgi:hypothetical protein